MNTSQVFRILIVLSIICFLTFQGVSISQNRNFGTQKTVGENSRILISPNQPQFELYSPSTQTFYETLGVYYALGKASGSSGIDLLNIKIDYIFSDILQTSITSELTALNSELIYNGLYYFSQSLWTIGTYLEGATLHSVVIQFDIDGTQINRIPLPMTQYQEDFDSGAGRFRQLLLVNATHIVFLESPTKASSTLVTFNRASSVFQRIDLHLAYHERFGHVNNDQLYLFYSSNPYPDIGDNFSGTIDDQVPRLHSYLVNQVDEPFSQTIYLQNTLSQTDQVRGSLVKNPSITEAVYQVDPANVLIASQYSLLPLQIRQFDNSIEDVFFGFAIEIPTSAFFDTTKIWSLAGFILFGVSAIIIRVRYVKEDNNVSNDNLLPIN